MRRECFASREHPQAATIVLDCLGIIKPSLHGTVYAPTREVVCLFFPLVFLFSVYLSVECILVLQTLPPISQTIPEFPLFSIKPSVYQSGRAHRMLFPDEVAGKVTAGLCLATCHQLDYLLMPQTNKGTTSTCTFGNIMRSHIIYVFVDIFLICIFVDTFLCSTSNQ